MKPLSLILASFIAFVGVTGKHWEFEDGVDFGGNDINCVRDSFDAQCLADCERNQECKGVAMFDHEPDDGKRGCCLKHAMPKGNKYAKKVVKSGIVAQGVWYCAVNLHMGVVVRTKDLRLAQSVLRVGDKGNPQAIIPMKNNTPGNPHDLDKTWVDGSMWWTGWDQIQYFQKKCSEEENSGANLFFAYGENARWFCAIIFTNVNMMWEATPDLFIAQRFIKQVDPKMNFVKAIIPMVDRMPGDPYKLGRGAGHWNGWNDINRIREQCKYLRPPIASLGVVYSKETRSRLEETEKVLSRLYRRVLKMETSPSSSVDGNKIEAIESSIASTNSRVDAAAAAAANALDKVGAVDAKIAQLSANVGKSGAESVANSESVATLNNTIGAFKTEIQSSIELTNSEVNKASATAADAVDKVKAVDAKVVEMSTRIAELSAHVAKSVAKSVANSEIIATLNQTIDVLKEDQEILKGVFDEIPQKVDNNTAKIDALQRFVNEKADKDYSVVSEIRTQLEQIEANVASLEQGMAASRQQVMEQMKKLLENLTG